MKMLEQRLDEIESRHKLVQGFSKEVMSETQAILDDPQIDDPGLVDMTHLPFITIDYHSSKDLDQALQIEREPDGFLVRYALADAGFYIREGTALFEEALARGASYYLPKEQIGRAHV